MWDSSKHLCSLKQPRTNSLGPQNRRQKKNHTNKLQELALMLPVALRTGTKKLTKKEILLHVLHYIHYLQRSIDVAKALLEFHTTDGNAGLAGLGWKLAAGPANWRHSTPSSNPHSHESHLWGGCRKPRKKKPARASECQTQAQNPRRCLALDKPEKQVTPSPDQRGGNMVGTITPPRCLDSCSHPKAASSPSQGDREGGRSWLTLLHMAENSVHCDISTSDRDVGFQKPADCCCKNSAQDAGPYPAFEAQQGVERIHFLNRTRPCPRQKLVLYDYSEEVDKESPDADPWLPAWTPKGSVHGSPLALGPPQIENWNETGHPSKILGLSPSLFSSPGKLLPEQIPEDDTEYLTPALFEEVFLDLASSPSACTLEGPQKKDTPPEAPEDLPNSHSRCQSLVSLDHCYLSLNENSKVPCSSSSEDTDTDSAWRQQADAQANLEGLQSSSDEDENYTWTPTQRAAALPAALPAAGRKTRAGRGLVKPKESKQAPCPTQVKKKCINGFIMFCRMNRKQYIRAYPGTASTSATKQLAQLWRMMTLKERRPYCTKARRFSRRHNRKVKKNSSSSEDEDWETPKPFYQLLAEKARRSANSAFPPPPHRA
ncbi:meiosis initiator protein [Mesoplodon densirostris]|uniref:meiosis initiator protein n=1 Tax=Mesoplodon densirostris TaxID=48708 RepID=UPI0028DCCE0B|nr:meiosis initiator protein [Mesoplodon densirostris]